MSRKIFIFLLVGVLLGIGGSKWYNSFQNAKEETSKISVDRLIASSDTESSVTDSDDEISAKVYENLKYVQTFHEPKDGYVGGKVFHNYEGNLPKTKHNGDKIKYREWDVNPKKGMLKRGKERLVTGDDKSAWYTNDHYKSFKKIN